VQIEEREKDVARDHDGSTLRCSGNAAGRNP